MNYSKLSYEEQDNELNEALSWLSQLGINCDSTRLGHYARTSKGIVNYRQSDPEFLNALYEINEIIKIHKNLKDFPSSLEILKKYKNIRKGPFQALDESSNSNDGRNLTFELFLISCFVKAGFEMNLNSLSDICFLFRDHEIFIECKRPQTFDSVEENIENACDQLSKRCLSKNSLGILALSIGKCFNQGRKLLNASDNAKLEQSLFSHLERFVKEHRTSSIIQKSSSQIIGLLGFLGTSGMVSSDNDTPTSLMGIAIGPTIHANSHSKHLLVSIVTELEKVIKA
ncbi:MAG: hypothetical protein ACOY3I_00130 [Verrucomicrobiota bacterium]